MMDVSDTQRIRRKHNLRKIISILVPLLIISVLVTAAYLLTTNQQLRYSAWYSPIIGLAIININIILVIVLLVVIFRNLVKLFSDRKRRIPGARFRTKLVLTMLAVTIVPTVLVSFTAVELVAKIIDFWSAQPVDKIVSSSNELAEVYQEDGREKALALARQLARYISEENLLSEDKYEPYLEEPIRSQINSVLASTLGDDNYKFIEEPLPAGTLVRCAVPVFSRGETSPDAKAIGAVILGYGVRRNLTNIASAIAGEFKAYREQAEQREVVKLSSQVLLLIVMLICLFLAIWHNR